MKTHNLITSTTVALLLSGCIPSVNPFYTEKDVVFDPRLPGEWQVKDKSDGPQIWKFEKAGDQAYKLTVTEKENKQGKFNAHLFKLETEHFLDIMPADCEYAANQADLVAFSMFPGHLLMRVSRLEPELELAFFDFDWLAKYLEKNPRAVAYHAEGRDEKRVVLTAGTRDLQRFVLKHLAEGELFGKADDILQLTRITPITSPK